jgi:hypothetical protein
MWPAFFGGHSCSGVKPADIKWQSNSHQSAVIPDNMKRAGDFVSIRP